MIIKTIYHSDYGHGWYAFKTKLIKELGLINKISSYSYEKGETIYCEEDCDAVKVIQALTNKGFTLTVKRGKVYDKASPIRNYKPFIY